MESFSIPAAGGLLLGSSAILLLLSLGRIAGISGVIWGALAGPDRHRRWIILIGLLIGGALTHFAAGMPLPARSNASLWLIACSGLLVGVGTQMGSGCTSGHGVCGLGRRSPRSLIATLTFMTLGIFTITMMRALFGGAA